MKAYVKHKNILNSILCVMLMLVAVLLMQTTIYAASATVSISSSNVTQGDEFEVIVTIKADANIGAYNFYIDYDANIIEAVSGFEGGGNGRIQMMYYVSSTDVTKELTAKIKFKAKSPGTTSLKYVSISDDNGVIDFDSADNMSVTATEGSVTVKAPYVASTNNYLSDLKVEAVKSDGSTYSLTLSPAFSKDVTKYTAEAVEGVTKLVVNAVQEDAKASVKISGTPMDPGDNTTTITVTAEDGSTRKYVIYTNVAKPPETTTPPPEPIIVQIDGTDSYIEDINDAVTLPEGFETFEYTYKDKKVVAAKGLVKSLIVMYVTKGDGSTGQLYIYEEATDTFYPMSNLQVTQKLYTIVKEPEELIIPAGFTETTVSVGEQSFKGWVNSDIENMYLVYAMNWNGEKGLYFYDVNEGQLMRYFEASVQTDANVGVSVEDYNKLLSEKEKLNDEINKLKADNNKEDSDSILLYKNLALGCCVMAVIYLGIIIVLVVRKKKNTEEDEEANTELAEEDGAETVEESEQEEASEKAEETSEEETSEEETSEEENAEENSEENSEVDMAVEAVITAVADEIKEDVVEEETLEDTTTEETIVSEEFADEMVVSVSEEGFQIDDEQDEIDDMLMDFEDIITGEVEAVIASETEVSDDDIHVETVEFSEEIEPDTEALKETIEEEDITEEATEEEAVEEDIAEEVAEEEATEEEAVEEDIAEEVAEEEVTEEEAVEEDVVEEATEEDVVEENIEETSTETTVDTEKEKEDKKKKVAEIMEDKDSSISADDLDMVIDELFDDLFD